MAVEIALVSSISPLIVDSGCKLSHRSQHASFFIASVVAAPFFYVSLACLGTVKLFWRL
jgi:hypothetical protein